MAPAKKREKDAATSNGNGAASAVSGGGNGGGNPATTTAAPTSASGTTAALTTTASANSTEGVKLNGHQQEQELFLQAFEKPTQIYRFLRNRHGTSPIFLNRTLSYMKDRMSRNNKKRPTFKVNSILDSMTQKTESISNNYLNIIFNGLFDKSSGSDQWWNAGDAVCVEATLYKITKSKRKDSTSDFQEMMSFTSNVVYNPHEDIEQFSAISIPVQSMRPFGDQHTIYKLLFRIKVTPKFSVTSKEENNENDETPNKRSKMSNKIYGCELIVFEKNICCIPEGDYEAALQELSSMSIKSFSPKKRTWETLPDNYIPLSMKFDVFNQFPTLKFRLTWSVNEIPNSIEAKDLNSYGGFAEVCANGTSASGLINGSDGLSMNGLIEKGISTVGTGAGAGAHINHNNNCVKSNNGPTVKAEKIQIVYNFLYSNNTRQQTEYTQEVICPWCGLDCLRLYALLKHLKLCHARFNFTYQPAGNGARIDVTINDSYDGSYAGSPYDLAGPSGCSFARTCGPVRRTSVTNLLVCRPRRQKTCLDEFLVLDEDDLSNQRPYITGHNRLYHHTETCLPVHPKELDIDSEGESDPLWLRQKTIQMIDEFSDVNEGEKELMKLWNLHVMKYGYVGDCQLPLACEMFLDSNGHEIIRKNLYRNFILHMCSLFDYGLVSPETVYKTVQKLQGILSKYPEGQEMMSKQREAQLKYWLEVGIHKQDEQKLKSPQKQATAAGSINITSTVEGKAETSSAGTTLTAVNATSTDNKKPMHPPTKRSATAVKRASMHPQNGHNATEKLANGAVSKGVAKKSASQTEDDNTLTSTSDRRERRSENVMKRSSAGMTTALANTSTEKEKNERRESHISERQRGSTTSGADTRIQAVKRRLSIKDTPQPASKRTRTDHTTSNNNSSSSNSNSGGTAMTRLSAQKQAIDAAVSSSTSGGRQHSTGGANTNAATTNTSTTTLPKRLITRRQSIAGTSSSEAGTTVTSKSGVTAAGKTTTTTATITHHSLRTRVSVPLTKMDKR